MSYYRTCPECGCNLDPGEICDCKKESEFKPDIRLYGNVQQIPISPPVVTEDVLIIGYDRSEKTDMACLTIARKNSDSILIIKELVGDEAIKAYENLTTGPCINYDPKMESFLRKNFNVPLEYRAKKSTFADPKLNK